MAQDGDTGSSTTRMADRLGVEVTALGRVRAQPINKGIIYSPDYGHVAFTVPVAQLPSNDVDETFVTADLMERRSSAIWLEP